MNNILSFYYIQTLIVKDFTIVKIQGTVTRKSKRFSALISYTMLIISFTSLNDESFYPNS